MAYMDMCRISEHCTSSSALLPLHVYVIGIPEGKEREKRTEKIFEELMGKTLVNAKRINTPRNIIVKQLNVKTENIEKHQEK